MLGGFGYARKPPPPISGWNQLARITVLIAQGKNQQAIAMVHVFENGRITRDGPSAFTARSLRNLSAILNKLPAFARRPKQNELNHWHVAG